MTTLRVLFNPILTGTSLGFLVLLLFFSVLSLPSMYRFLRFPGFYPSFLSGVLSSTGPPALDPFLILGLYFLTRPFPVWILEHPVELSLDKIRLVTASRFGFSFFPFFDPPPLFSES